MERRGRTEVEGAMSEVVVFAIDMQLPACIVAKCDNARVATIVAIIVWKSLVIHIYSYSGIF